MYAVAKPDLEAFWAALRRHLEANGVTAIPAALAEPDDLHAHWCDPALVLGQTCGYPLVTALAGQVRYVATPCYEAEGCEGPYYRSAVLVRAADPAQSLADLRGRRAAFNDPLSQSGLNSLRAMVAPLATAGRFFGSVIETGAHSASIAAVLEGRADVAAIDAVTWALAKTAMTDLPARLRVLLFTDRAPALPFVTAAATSDATVAALRSALQAICRDPGLEPVLRRMLLRDVAVLDPGAYEAAILGMVRVAQRHGYAMLG